MRQEAVGLVVELDEAIVSRGKLDQLLVCGLYRDSKTEGKR